MCGRFRGFLSKVVSLILLLSFLFFPSRASSATTNWSETISEQKTKIVATTSLIGDIVEKIGKDRLNITIIVPAGMCPGHFDIKPGEVRDLWDAKVIIIHGWEKWIEKLIRSTKKKLPIKTIKIEENWMVPDVQIRAAKEITRVLSGVDPQEREWYEKNLIEYREEIQSLAKEIEKVRGDLSNVRVVCASYQEGFLKWLGFDVISTYGRQEELTSKEIVEIIKEAKKEGVQIVVDNLQSGPDAGLLIAKEIGADHLVLTNFPTNGYITSLKENINKIGQILGWQKL